MAASTASEARLNFCANRMIRCLVWEMEDRNKAAPASTNITPVLTGVLRIRPK
jgi:hypothetical protein